MFPLSQAGKRRAQAAASWREPFSRSSRTAASTASRNAGSARSPSTGLGEPRGDRDALLVPIEQPRVDVGGARDRGRVAELGRDLLDRRRDPAPARRLRGGHLPARGERHGREHRPVPGSEVLGREAVTRELLHVRVDVLRTHVAPPRAVAVREQLGVLVAAALQRPDDGGDLGVRDLLDPPLAALGAVVEPDEVARRADVVPPDRREPERSVVPGVGLGAHAEQGEVEQPHGHRERLLARQVPALEIGRHALAHLGQPVREGQHPVELLGVSPGAPALVVQVLPPSGGVGPRRLQVAQRVRADPHVRPGRRDRERADASDRLVVLDRFAVRPGVREAATTALPPDPRTVARHPSQPRHRAEGVARGTRGQTTGPRRGPRSRGYLPSDRRTDERGGGAPWTHSRC